MAKMKCGVCGKKFPPAGRRKYCTTACAAKKLREQLAALGERRKVGRPGKRPCDVCGREYQPRFNGHKYCGAGCAAEGLRRAVERQRQRREEAKGGDNGGQTGA